MKTKLSILLAITMLVACVLSVMPSADATGGVSGLSSDSYEPVIAYSNLNYVDDLVLMFAVPAPASLDDGSSVKVVIWTNPSAAYSYKDSLTTETSLPSAKAIEAETARATIGGVEHLVFKYRLADPKMMTDVIYARPVVVNSENKAVSYGNVVDYSVVEYVASAKGEFNGGTPVVNNNKVLELLDSILDFGAMMQTFRGEDELHLPNGYLANEELHKIWITPVVRGEVGEKVFGGFFKYEEDGYANLYAPFFDGYSAISYKDSLGNELTDANPSDFDDALGFQLDAVDGDIEVVIEYDRAAIRELNASEFGEGFAVNNVDNDFKGDPETLTTLGCNYDQVGNVTMKAGVRINFSDEAGSAGSLYAGFKTVPDPEDEDNLLLQVTSTHMPVIDFSQPLTIADYNKYGYGDTLEEAITFEAELGRPSPESSVTVSYFFLQNVSDGAKQEHTTQETRVYLFGVANNNVILDNGAKVCELPETGTVKIAFTLLASGEVKTYYSNADGEMIESRGLTQEQFYKSMGKEYKDKHAKYLANLEDDDPENDDVYLPYASIANFLSMNSLDAAWTFGRKMNNTQIDGLKASSVDMNGQRVPVINANGGYNFGALQQAAEESCSIYLKSWKIYVGDIYK